MEHIQRRPEGEIDMGYRVRLSRKDGKPLGKREYLVFRDINNDGGGYTHGTLSHAEIFDSKEEIYSKEIMGFVETLQYDFAIEETT